MSASDPFYLVKEEVQDSVNKLQSSLGRWEKLPYSAAERIVLSKELQAGCESIEWQVDELDRATGVAERDPARFSVDVAEIERRKKWTASTLSQVHFIKGKLQNAAERNIGGGLGQGNRRELMRMEDQFEPKINSAMNDTFHDESDRQALIMKEQDEDLDDLSATVVRLGDVGLTIHGELSSQVLPLSTAFPLADDYKKSSVTFLDVAHLSPWYPSHQEKYDFIVWEVEHIHEDFITIVMAGLMDELGNDMDSTASRLDVVQKKVVKVMKKAGWKGQVMMIVFLVVLLLILTFLVFSS